MVWRKNREIFLALEIDFANRKKSVEKLLAVEARYKVWVFMGARNPMEHMQQLDKKREISLIQPNTTKKRFPEVGS